MTGIRIQIIESQRHLMSRISGKTRPVNKAALQEELGLDKDNHVMLIGIVSSLTDQKGFDLIDYMMDEMCQDAVQIAVLGTGDPKYENMFRHFAWKYAGKVSANIFYSDDLSHRLYAGCDAFLMPSLIRAMRTQPADESEIRNTSDRS